MEPIQTIDELPKRPAVYAMYSGRGRSLHAAYVDMVGDLRSRIEQHLVRRDSSVAAGTSAAALNPDLITEVRWSEHPKFTEQYALAAAELVAFELFEPALRSRGGICAEAKRLFEKVGFKDEMRSLFEGEPAGRLVLPTLQEALERIARLEERLAAVVDHIVSRPEVREHRLENLRTACQDCNLGKGATAV